MHTRWKPFAGVGVVCSALPRHEYPIVILWYGLFDKKLSRGKPRTVKVLYRKADDDNDVPKSKSIPFRHLRELRIGSVWRQQQHVGDVSYSELFEQPVDFSLGSWKLVSDRTEVEANRAPLLSDEYRLTDMPRVFGSSWLLEFRLPTGTRLLIPCVEFLLRYYGWSEVIARALVSDNWQQIISRLVKTTVPEIKNDGRWVVQPAEGLLAADGHFLAHFVHVPAATNAVKAVVEQCAQGDAGENKSFALRVTPWFYEQTILTVHGVWLHGGRTFLGLRVKPVKAPSGKEIVARKDKVETTLAKEDTLHGMNAKAGNAKTTVSDAASLTTQSFTDIQTRVGTPTLPAPRQQVGFTLGTAGVITNEYTSSPEFLTRLDEPTGPAVTPLAEGTDLPAAHRLLVTDGTLLEMWTALCAMKNEPRSKIQEVAWLDAKHGFVKDRRPEMIPLAAC